MSVPYAIYTIRSLSYLDTIFQSFKHAVYARQDIQDIEDSDTTPYPHKTSILFSLVSFFYLILYKLPAFWSFCELPMKTNGAAVSITQAEKPVKEGILNSKS